MLLIVKGTIDLRVSPSEQKSQIDLMTHVFKKYWHRQLCLYFLKTVEVVLPILLLCIFIWSLNSWHYRVSSDQGK